MASPILLIITAALIGLAIVAMTVLMGWQGWLQLKLRELEQGKCVAPENMSARIEMADLKERIRKLEAIAAGVDLGPMRS
ncbi:MAG: hypothetical protein ABIR23_07750 [Novosphingobium sp.]